ncbi:DUF368 domain-containing protein [Motiliproteus sp. SC1-56]|uniref:DUF368 domain-containing protein n=1 Tax=Motiliproteus sp. SC1-56 TaxID=2799565 RepID=UPI001A8CCA65|nr:DUF368 domain-containing protein [Motiliproteus sp. SC1-56]
MRQWRDWFYLFLRGVGMGAADAVPGVSGGTVAFITGIYEELVDSIRSITPAAFATLLREGPVAFWRRINGSFLLVLISGILISLMSLARVAVYLLENHPAMLWAFFFGLILASAVWMVRQVPEWGRGTLAGLGLGAAFAFALTQMTPVEAPITALSVFLAGAVAICAMILPGISGSFILLLIGMYGPIMGAIKGFQLDLIGLFLGGCVVGLLSFSHLLAWTFKRYHSLTLAVLTGFMLGSLGKVWPWKYTTAYRIDSHGEQVPLLQENVLPASYHALTGEEPLLGLALVLMLAGGALVYILENRLNARV